MNAPIGATTEKLAREQQRSPVPQKVKPPVSSALLDLIDCSCPANDGYVAPTATKNADEEQRIVIDPSAPMLDFEEKKAASDRTRDVKRNGQRREEKAIEKAMRGAAKARQSIKPAINERAKRVPRNTLEEVYELVRLHRPLSAWEATTRMQRCGYPKASTLRALAALQDQGSIVSTNVQLPKGHPPVLVYEVKP